MRIDELTIDCPKCKATLKLAGETYNRIPSHFVGEQTEGVWTTQEGGERFITALTFRKLCRLSGAEIVSLIGLGGTKLAP